MNNHTDGIKNPISEAIEDAEEIRDPLEGLIERAKTDPGAAFKPDVLECLAALRCEDPARFEVIRAELRKTKCRITAFDDALAAKGGDGGGRDPKQADILIELAETAELYHAQDGTGFADIVVNGHRETWPIRSKGFRRWLGYSFYEKTQGAPNSEALQSALNVIEAKAHFDGLERIVHVRVGDHDGKLYLDLGNEKWQAVEIDTKGWRVIDEPPVRFRRAAGMQPLPIPQRGGSINDLRRFLNVKSDDDFVLAVAYLVAALRSRGPYPVLALAGEQGSAKSTFARVLKSLVDPNTAPLRSLPREDRDLFIAASNGHILAFDNVSRLSPVTSDALCRLSTGGSYGTRELYTNQDEVLFDVVRPLILNGIEEVVEKPDLADRSLFLTLEAIPEERRLPEEEFWDAFNKARPRILGVLLDAVVRGLEMLPAIRLARLPRMADFARWAAAWETAFWPASTFEAAYGGNRNEAVEVVVESDQVAVAVRTFIAKRVQWTGTAAQLLVELGAEVGEPQNKSKEWPTSARALSGRMRRAATFLRKVGVEIAFKHAGTRKIHISASAENGGIQPPVSSAPSTSPLKSKADNGFAPHPTGTMLNNSDDCAAAEHADRVATVRANPTRNNGMDGSDGSDGSDANFPPQSGREKAATGMPEEVGNRRESGGDMAEVEL